MAGGYTHLTLVRSAIRLGRRKIPALKDVLDHWSLDTGVDNHSKQLRLWPWKEKLVKIS